MPTLLLDRDGVINENRDDYVTRWEQFRFLDGAIEAMAELCAAGLRLVVITNQSAVGRRLMTAEQLEYIHRRMLERCRSGGARIDGVFVCPHAPEDGCACRKPRPGLLRRALSALGEGREQCLAIGDSWEDLLAARAAGVAFGLVLSGRGERALEHPAVRRHAPLFVARDLQDAVSEVRRHLLPLQREVAA